MSTPELPAAAASGTTTLVLPAGVQLGTGRETSQTNAQGAVVQGIQYPVTLPSGTATSVFVPYSQIANITQVQAIFDARINALLAIGG